MFEFYKRWRHTRGYGVHSPYAYEMVLSVLRPGKPYGYYGYSAIEAAMAPGCAPGLRRMARMLLRLVSFTGAQRVYLPQGVPTPCQAAVKAVGKKVEICSAAAAICRCDLVACRGNTFPPDVLADFLKVPGHAVALTGVPAGLPEALAEALPGGVVFHSPGNLIAVCRPHMQTVVYSARF